MQILKFSAPTLGSSELSRANAHAYVHQPDFWGRVGLQKHERNLLVCNARRREHHRRTVLTAPVLSDATLTQY